MLYSIIVGRSLSLLHHRSLDVNPLILAYLFILSHQMSTVLSIESDDSIHVIHSFTMRTELVLGVFQLYAAPYCLGAFIFRHRQISIIVLFVIIKTDCNHREHPHDFVNICSFKRHPVRQPFSFCI